MNSYLHIGTDPVLHQNLADLSVAPQRSPVQSGVAVNIHQIHLRPPCNRLLPPFSESAHTTQAAGMRSAASTFNEGEYNVSVAHLAGAEQRRVLHHVQGVHHGPSLQQQLHRAHVARQGGRVKRCDNTRVKKIKLTWIIIIH